MVILVFNLNMLNSEKKMVYFDLYDFFIFEKFRVYSVLRVFKCVNFSILLADLVDLKINCYSLFKGDSYECGWLWRRLFAAPAGCTSMY